MDKETFYFSHDYNARSDKKIKKLLLAMGWEGYGLWWAILEDLYNNANALPTDYESIAFDLRTDEDKIKRLINDFDLFVVDGDFFMSNSVDRRLKKRELKSLKAKESAEKRWGKSKRNANALPAQSDSNTIKDIKGYKSKVKDKEITFPFPSDEFKVKWQEWIDWKAAERKGKYRTADGEQKALSGLYNLSGEDEQTAIAIINQSMMQGYQGLFPLKNKPAAPSAGLHDDKKPMVY